MILFCLGITFNAALLQGSTELATGFEQWSSTVAANDSESHLGTPPAFHSYPSVLRPPPAHNPLLTSVLLLGTGACLGTLSNFQKHFGDLLATLGTSIDMKVTEPMANFTKEEIPATIAIKKKWDSTRRDYDSGISKVTLLQREKKPNPPKIQQAEQERERLKGAYLQKGEEAFCSLLDTNETSEFETLEKLLTYIESFYQFFRGGYQFLREVHDNAVIGHRQWIAEERVQFEQRSKKRPAGEWVPDSISGGATAKTRMFGLPYEELIRRDAPANLIPVWLEKAIEFLEQKALGIQGVFRVSPPKTQLDDTKKKIDGAQEIDWTSLDEHVCTGTIKLFLRELPQPLLTFELYSKFVAAADGEDDSSKVKAIKSVLAELPKPNSALLRRLLALMVLIERNKEVNKMTSTNLAVVLCPSILYPEVPDPLTMVDDIQRANRVMSLFITHYTDIFGATVAGPTISASSAPSATSAATPTSPAGAKSVSFHAENASSSPSLTSPSSSNLSNLSNPGLTSSAGTPGKRAAPVVPSRPHPTPPAKGTVPHTETTPTRPASLSNEKLASPSFTAATGAGASSIPVTITGTSADTPPSSLNLTHSSSNQSIGHSSSSDSINLSSESGSTSSLGTPSHASAAPREPEVLTFPTSVIPSIDPAQRIDLDTMKFILQEKAVGPTFDYFMSMQELAEANCAFSSTVLSPGLSNEHVPALNAALKNLAKAIKNILTSIREFSTKLPPELRNRLLMAAKELQDRVLSTAGAFKEFDQGLPGANNKLVENTRMFVVSVYAIAARFKEFSLVDELLSSTDGLHQLIEELPRSFASGDSTNIAVTTNSIQSASFKLTALLRSKILDSAQQAQVSALAACIESAEKETRELCDAVKGMLFDESLQPQDLKVSPLITERLASLDVTCKKAESFYETISPAQNASVTNALLFAPILDQLNTNINTHASSTDPKMQNIVAALKGTHEAVSALRPTWNELGTHTPPPSFAARFKWISEFSKVSNNLVAIIAATQSITNDPHIDAAMARTLASYTKSVSAMNLYLRISSAAEAFDIQACTDSLTRSMSIVKDFVFVSFPVLFNIRDALSQLEEERNNPQ